MNNPLTKEQLREKIAKVMSDWGVDFYEGNLIHREEQRLSIIRGFQDAMIDIIDQFEQNLLKALEEV